MILVVLLDGYDSIRIQMWKEFETFGIGIKRIYYFIG